MKKLISLMLALVLSFTLLACSASVDVENTDADTTESVAESDETTTAETATNVAVPSDPIDWDGKLAEYKDNADVNQLVFIKYKSGTDADLYYYIKDTAEETGWRLDMQCTADTAKNGIDKEKEGDAKTPTGDYGLVRAIGIKENPGTALEYTQLTEDMYLCNDVPETYNTLVDIWEVDHVCKGTHLIEKAPDYNYAIDIDFNASCIWEGGSGIFLRCRNDQGKQSTGCVAIDEENLVYILKSITEGARIVIGR